MPHDFLPERQAELLNWSRAFRQQIVAQPTVFGLTAEQAAWYATLDDAFAHELKLAQEPTTRTPVQIKKKNEAKKALKAGARMLARIVRATPGVTNAAAGAVGADRGG
jgi:vacuolar-type H+-ATPase catalytic subunit A/Vma1